MVLSRGLSVLRLTNHVARNYLLQNGKHNFQKQITRHGHGGGEEWYYRKLPDHASPKAIRFAEVLGAITWWWLIWHILTDYHELIGSSPYPDPSTWTDEELGIPPEDED